MLTSLVAGTATGLALIVALGAQNAFVLRQALLRDHVALIVAICAVSDVLLILAGVAGIGVLVEQAPTALVVVRWLGVAFLGWYGVSSLVHAARPDALTATGGRRLTARQAAVRVTALTWLNPHVYLDTVLLLGSVATTHGGAGRWWFAVGASVGSVLWFAGLGYGARLLSGLLSSTRSWQVLDVLIGLTMLAIAAGLAVGS